MNDYTRTQPVSFDLTRHRVDVAEDPLLKQAEADPDDCGVPVSAVYIFRDMLPAVVIVAVAAAVVILNPYWWPK